MRCSQFSVNAVPLAILGFWIGVACLAARGADSNSCTVPLRFQEGLLWVEVQADATQRPLHFLIDSGASISVLNRGTASTLGLKLGPKATVAGVGTTSIGYGPIPWSAKVGPVDLPKSILVLDLSQLSAACSRPVDGLVGADFFRDRIVEIDYATETLRVLEGAPELRKEEAIPLVSNHRGFSVRASVNGGEDQCLRVDTGCASALQWVSPRTQGRLCPGAPSVGLARVSVPQTLAGIRLGSHQVDTVPTGLHRKPIFAQEAGLLGNGLLAMFGCVIFDSRAGLLHLGNRSTH